MKGKDRVDIFLDKLKEDFKEYKNMETAGYSLAEKKNTIRSLMNIRMPGAISGDLLDLQDKYLQEELGEKGIVELSDIPTAKEQFGSRLLFAEKISLWQGDITRLKTGAIVNAANSRMLGCFVPCHRCIDNAIHSAAGIRLREECNRYMGRRKMQYGPQYEEPTGQAVLTKGYGLPARHVIHTVGPIVTNLLTDGLKRDLENCYWNVLQCCVENGIKTVAFCCISTGEFRFPRKEAAQIAVRTVLHFLEIHGQGFDRIIFNVFQDADEEVYGRIFSAL